MSNTKNSKFIIINTGESVKSVPFCDLVIAKHINIKIISKYKKPSNNNVFNQYCKNVNKGNKRLKIKNLEHRYLLKELSFYTLIGDGINS